MLVDAEAGVGDGDGWGEVQIEDVGMDGYEDVEVEGLESERGEACPLLSILWNDRVGDVVVNASSFCRKGLDVDLYMVREEGGYAVGGSETCLVCQYRPAGGQGAGYWGGERCTCAVHSAGGGVGVGVYRRKELGVVEQEDSAKEGCRDCVCKEVLGWLGKEMQLVSPVFLLEKCGIMLVRGHLVLKDACAVGRVLDFMRVRLLSKVGPRYGRLQDECKQHFEKEKRCYRVPRDLFVKWLGYGAKHRPDRGLNVQEQREGLLSDVRVFFADLIKERVLEGVDAGEALVQAMAAASLRMEEGCERMGGRGRECGGSMRLGDERCNILVKMLHAHFVSVPVDKQGHGVVHVCKLLYSFSVAGFVSAKEGEEVCADWAVLDARDERDVTVPFYDVVSGLLGDRYEADLKRKLAGVRRRQVWLERVRGGGEQGGESGCLLWLVLWRVCVCADYFVFVQGREEVLPMLEGFIRAVVVWRRMEVSVCAVLHWVGCGVVGFA